MKKWELALLLGLVLAVFCVQFTTFAQSCDAVRDDTLRLHILANSDTATDQSCKLAVRDALLASYGGQLAQADSLAEAKSTAQGLLPAMQYTAKQIVAARGFDYSVSVRLERMYFAPKQYDDFTLPAGDYDAVRVEIGGAAGHNWFCVMYPALCLPAAGENSAMAVYTAAEQRAVKTPYTVKFAVLEWAQNLR
ncbi:MAG: stage II sporulation protein R [Ruthenibacterium sp.]